MKKILFILSVLLIAVACKKEPIQTNNGVYDPNAKITIKEAPAKSLIPGLSAMEIVENAVNIKWTTHYSDNEYYETPVKIARTFGEHMKDYNKPALLMWGVDILHPVLLDMHPNSEYGIFRRDFIDGFDVYITDGNNDSIAYIPNEVLRAARPLIWQAYCDSNYTEVYRLFDEAFTFIPIERKK